MNARPTALQTLLSRGYRPGLTRTGGKTHLCRPPRRRGDPPEGYALCGAFAPLPAPENAPVTCYTCQVSSVRRAPGAYR